MHMQVSHAKTPSSSSQTNPFTPKASLIRYWNNHISNNLPKPLFLFSKASPLNAQNSAILTNLATQNSLSSHFHSFCSLANLYCPFNEENHSLTQVSDTNKDSNFAVYSNKHFASYGSSKHTGLDSFKNYSDRLNNANDSFKKYSRASTSHRETFTSYENNVNVAESNFTSYASGATRALASSTTTTNSSASQFSLYNSAPTTTNSLSHSDDTNSGYSELGKAGNFLWDEFCLGKSFNHGNDTFKEYGKGSVGRGSMVFKSYSMDRTFKDYVLKGVTFSEYNNFSTATENSTSSIRDSGNSVNRWVEPGKFFRESMLKEGNVIVMPDIRDRMPKRSFLPRVILSKLPFSTLHLSEMKELFHAQEKSSMERVLINALAECERAPSLGETKRCVGSVEDMIDFAVSVLGHNVVVRSTENVSGSKQNVMIGSVKGINGGEVTNLVSCHQRMYPYLLYYCHSVPKVRVYQADILDVESKAKINHGVAICHIDTSAWGPEHGAFLALGVQPRTN
uniref:BURP domain-containing protein n=1 Tax=Fagus sylvatica TaxID=28930 RepID=A0A2N9GGG9_FAGSY